MITALVALQLLAGQTAAPSSGQSTAPVPAYECAPYVAKTLYAKNDFRGKKAPELKIEKWLKGGLPESAKGKVILVDFWATWCPPCRKLIDELNEWSEKYKDQLVIVGISDEPEATVSKFMETKPMNYNVAIDTKSQTSNVIGVEGIPHVLVITPDGIVRWQGFTMDDKDRLTTEKLGKILATALQKDTPPATSKTK